MYAATGGPHVKGGAPISNGGAVITGPPAGDGSAGVVVNSQQNPSKKSCSTSFRHDSSLNCKILFGVKLFIVLHYNLYMLVSLLLSQAKNTQVYAHPVCSSCYWNETYAMLTSMLCLHSFSRSGSCGSRAIHMHPWFHYRMKLRVRGYSRPVLFNIFCYSAPLKMFWRTHAPYLLQRYTELKIAMKTILQRDY